MKITLGQFNHLKALSNQQLVLTATTERTATSGRLVTYDGDTDADGLPSLQADLSALRIAETGGDGVLLHLTYLANDDEVINDRKKTLVERVGAEAKANHLPLVLALAIPKTAVPAPEAVIAMTREFSDPRYNASVLTLPTPVPLSHVDGFTKTPATPTYDRAQAAALFKQQSAATDLPLVVDATGLRAADAAAVLNFAHDSGEEVNGLLASPSVLTALAKPLSKVATPWTAKVEVED
ncbi:hypothetical protein FC75_GL002053 [Lacticaseibacillus camelliae DSM 22697 = JCM 13995]|uniref:Uncharacterized protein n=1 Tax=Lacticaseibacillus camelliae DSM 22697 = JCM 13995 TaxID=1423730 RepID=A0A0R2FCP8_9LACO|nr:hypothetical protein FC75_GL002053 [Lacticaseibacillus camelliae DSM 22697 = JCM 13995]